MAEGSAILCQQSHWLSAITVARSLLETIAAYNEVVRKLRNLIRGGDIDDIFEFISAAGFATRLPHLIDVTGEPAVKAPNVLSQIDNLNKTDGNSARNDYDYICEFTHPNSLGTLLFFGRFDKKSGTMHFCSQGWDPESVGIWVAWVCSMLLVTLENDKTIEKLAQQISDMNGRGS